jgi:hypothetical protein
MAQNDSSRGDSAKPTTTETIEDSGWTDGDINETCRQSGSHRQLRRNCWTVYPDGLKTWMPSVSRVDHDRRQREALIRWRVVGKWAFPEDEPIYRILDCHSVHQSQESRNGARDVGMGLMFMPATADRAVFGTSKAIVRRLFRMQAMDSPRPAMTTQFLVRP